MGRPSEYMETLAVGSLSEQRDRAKPTWKDSEQRKDEDEAL